MLQDATPSDNALCQLAQRFHQDSDFHALVKRDTHAALNALGIQVPKGVNVRFAADAASALGMMLDHPPEAAPPLRGAVLDDAQLLGIAGGVSKGYGPSSELQQFLSLFRPNMA
ncbi:hypothetical protein [Parapusillimonas granuli]|nr:hypothetical protein [Parapusillimonas granuli]MEB2399102.1 hypothetical protein [Alcaligenaceae bacterium]